MKECHIPNIFFKGFLKKILIIISKTFEKIIIIIIVIIISLKVVKLQ